MNTITFAEAPLIWEEIRKAKNILMHNHPNPDADTVGSTLAFLHAFNAMGKKATLIKGDSNKPDYLKSLPGYDLITEKNFFETDLNEFDLFLILDSGSLNQISKLGEVVFPANLKTIVIDHHKSNTGYGDINLIDPTYPATCQMVYELFKMWNVPITPDMAICLFTGIYTDTGGFRYKPASVTTFEAATELVRLAPNFTDILFAMGNNNTRGRLLLEGILLSSIETFFNDSVAFASISHITFKEKGITEFDASGMDVASTLKSVVGWNVGASLIEREEGIVKVSFRTRDVNLYDVSKVATELGGGGHAGAAGAQILGTLAEAKARILTALGHCFPILKK